MYIMRNCDRFYGNGVWSYENRDKPTCPLCGLRLFSHGTCKRRVTTEDGLEIHRLRVLKCRNCKRTHRELPDTIIPYKHYGRETISTIVAGKAKCGYEDSTRYRLMQWFRALLFLVVSSLEGQKRELCNVMRMRTQNRKGIEPEKVSRWLKLCVRKLVWQGNLAPFLE